MFRNTLLRSVRAAATPIVRPSTFVGAINRPVFSVRTYAGFPALSRDIAKERILELLEGYDKIDSSKEISELSSYVQDLGLDSLDVVEVIMELEHEFNIQIPDNESDSLKTVGQTIDYVLSQKDAV